MNKKKLFIFSSLIIIIYISYLVTLINNYAVSSSDISIYISENKGLAFQLHDNTTQLLTCYATNNAFNVTLNNLFLEHDEGEFHFTPQTNSTINITHNMDYVTIKGQNHTTEATQLGFNTDNLGIFENEKVIIIFKIKPYDVSDIFFKIGMFTICISGLILTPPMSDIFARGDKREQVFIWVAGWLLFGILFFVWIYSW